MQLYFLIPIHSFVSLFPSCGGYNVLSLLNIAGLTAARNMLGRNEEINTIPFFWTSQYGKSIRYCGKPLLNDCSYVVCRCHSRQRFAVSIYLAGEPHKGMFCMPWPCPT